jgi:hypothetical protein
MSTDALSASAGGYRLPNLKGLLILYLPNFALLFLVAIAALGPQITVASLTRDMAATAKVHPLTGVVSNVGILLWCATAAICLFSSNLLRQRGAHRAAGFLLWSGLMTAGLLVDDFFMFHEYLAPVHLGLDEKVVLLGYVCITAVYLLQQRRLILEADYRLLVSALVLFTGSMMIDLADVGGWWNLAEDGCKLLGIASWFGYLAGRAKQWLALAPDARTQMTNVASRKDAPPRTQVYR